MPVISIFSARSGQATREECLSKEEAARKKKEYEDQLLWRFSNAAGFKQSLESPGIQRALLQYQPSRKDTPRRCLGNEDQDGEKETRQG